MKRYLFVWEGVYCDYTCGIAFAIAIDLEEAMKLILAKAHYEDLPIEKMKKYELTESIGFQVSGGG